MLSSPTAIRSQRSSSAWEIVAKTLVPTIVDRMTEGIPRNRLAFWNGDGYRVL
jgi:hypothetical protein